MFFSTHFPNKYSVCYQLNGLVENNFLIAITVLAVLYEEGNNARLLEFLMKLVDMELSLQSVEVVNR